MDRLPWTLRSALPADSFEKIRRTLMLDCCKWDPQVGDVATLAEFPIVLSPETWRFLAGAAERLTTEALAAEKALLRRPSLWASLDVPGEVKKVLGPDIAAPRIMRFDFHWTTQGWRISEVNSDVPGGFSEAFEFAALMAKHFPGTTPAGDPAGSWMSAVRNAMDGAGSVALVASPPFLEDQQVVAYLARRLGALGCRAHVTEPGAIRWNDSGEAATDVGPVDAIVRFYQAEWLAGLPRRGAWHHFFRAAKPVMTNPGQAILIESKRFPVVWEQLGLEMSAWRALLPETRDPREADWETSDQWLVKSAYSNTGDTVTIRDEVSAGQWKEVARDVRNHPRRWVAQRRFSTVPVETPRGTLYPCLGVYTVDGRAAGIYGRLSRGAVIDYQAIDCAVLVEASREH